MEEHMLSTFASYAVYALGGALTWWVKTVWSTVRQQQQDIHELHVKMASDYVTKAELNSSLDRIFNAIDGLRKDVHK